MGCFDKTCCLTNTSISEGEQCLVIVPNKVENTNLYDTMDKVRQQSIRKNKELSNRELNMIKEYKCFDLAYFLPIRNVFYGIYNDYGSIEEDERVPEDYEDFRMGAQMFHVWAIESLFNKNIDELIKDPIKLVYDIYSQMYFLRKTPFGLELSGQQHKDVKEMELMIKLNEETNKYLKSKIDERKKWEEDE